PTSKASCDLREGSYWLECVVTNTSFPIALLALFKPTIKPPTPSNIEKALICLVIMLLLPLQHFNSLYVFYIQLMGISSLTTIYNNIIHEISIRIKLLIQLYYMFLRMC